MPDDLCPQSKAGDLCFDVARSYGIHGGILREAILELKFHGRERLGRKLGETLLPAWRAAEPRLDRSDEPPIIVPVPLHPSRQRRRGFNQSELLAGGLARAWARSLGRAPAAWTSKSGGPRVETGVLVRARPTASQTNLSLLDRQKNVSGAFTVRRPERCRGRLAILVDDVMTTGATASACARALKDAGAAQVGVLTLARAEPPSTDPDSSPERPESA